MSVMAVIKLRAHRGRREELLQEIQEPIRLTREHPECSSVNLLIDADDSDLLVFVEQWSSAEAHINHVDKMMEAGVMVTVMPLIGSQIDTQHFSCTNQVLPAKCA